jgi:hypothetical protein
MRVAGPVSRVSDRKQVLRVASTERTMWMEPMINAVRTMWMARRMSSMLLALIALVGIAPGCLPQPSESMWQRKAVTDDGAFTVWWRVAGERDVLPDSDPFDLEVRVDDVNGAPTDVRLELDAEMPHHGHGMNVRPVVERVGPGRFIVKGVLLHMSGRWELAFDLGDPDGVQWRRAQCTVEAP